MQPLVALNAEVAAALAARKPVVALESTVISHGLPYPRNLEVARGMEDAVRSAGAVPATVAILGGRLKAGLDTADLERLATGRNIRKCSRRDLPIVMAAGGDGATTVAGTMYVAHLAGIQVFATGGIGGVHRGHPFDVSADLPELAQTPVTVVCAGAKAILDLPLTLEYLETHGVPVLGIGTDELPAFYTRSSGLRLDRRCETPADAAAIVRAQRQLGLKTGALVTVPVPAEAELPAAEAEAAIAQALAEADARGVHGKDVTPFLLARVSELTGAKSQRANIALLMNNARVAAQIAAALVGV